MWAHIGRSSTAQRAGRRRGPDFVSELAPIVTSSGFRVLPLSDFTAARHELYALPSGSPGANLRLGAFNGIHLAYLAKINNPETRVMIYGEGDRMLAAEVQSAGAFYERAAFVLYALAGFLRAPLPDRDRRAVDATDRRQLFRGGRRTTDLQILPTAAAT